VSIPSRARAVLARHSGGVKSVQRILPAANLSVVSHHLEDASLASMISPVRLEMKIPMMLASTKRRIFASRSADSRYKTRFSSAIAACEASSFSTASRAGVNTCDAGCFRDRDADQLGPVSATAGKSSDRTVLVAHVFIFGKHALPGRSSRITWL